VEDNNSLRWSNVALAHGRNTGCTGGWDDGGEKCAHGERRRCHGEREWIPTGDAVKLGGNEASGAKGERQPEDQAYRWESYAQATH
jgi:hypothetical protein